MDFDKYEESLLKAHSNHTDHRDWIVIAWLLVSFPVIGWMGSTHRGQAVVSLVALLISHSMTLASLIIDKTVYAHFISRMIHSKSDMDVQKWVSLNTRLSMSTAGLFVLNAIIVCVYFCQILSR